MQKIQNHPIDIKSIIDKEEIVSCFQPIVSLTRKTVNGIEALSRGRKEKSGELISPCQIFKTAQENGLSIELDRLCRKKALETFEKTFGANSNILLFLNIDTSIIDMVVGSSHLINSIKMLGLAPSNIVIEICESKVISMDLLEKFINKYREYGFLIALDDVGAGFSNLDRFLIAKPDIVKVDRGIIHNIDKQYHKQEIFKALVSLSKKIGALVVAEGIETMEEAMMTMELGADMLQGYYLARPAFISELVCDNKIINVILEDRINTVVSTFRNHIDNKIREEKQKQARHEAVMEEILIELTHIPLEEVQAKMTFILNKYRSMECIYLLDEYGTQISETICKPGLKLKNQHIFNPALKGVSHALKRYYYFLTNTGLRTYVTSPYISLATGNICTTVSAILLNRYGNERDKDKNCVLCIDFSEEM